MNKTITMTNEKSQNSYAYGLSKGLPIALGYLSVSFGFGITAIGMGIPSLGTILISLTNLTSAGQLAGIGIIAACGTIIEMILTQLVINMRYCLMGLALTQKLDSSFTTPHRMITSFAITDEVFAVAAAERGLIGRRFMYGLITLPPMGWTLGTVLGVYAGQVLPYDVRMALQLALYGMFVAIIVPPAKKDKGVLYAVLIASAMSCAMYYIPLLSKISTGFQVIICAVAASGIMAVIAPKNTEDED